MIENTFAHVHILTKQNFRFEASGPNKSLTFFEHAVARAHGGKIVLSAEVEVRAGEILFCKSFEDGGDLKVAFQSPEDGWGHLVLREVPSRDARALCCIQPHPRDTNILRTSQLTPLVLAVGILVALPESEIERTFTALRRMCYVPSEKDRAAAIRAADKWKSETDDQFTVQGYRDRTLLTRLLRSEMHSLHGDETAVTLANLFLIRFSLDDGSEKVPTWQNPLPKM